MRVALNIYPQALLPNLLLNVLPGKYYFYKINIHLVYYTYVWHATYANRTEMKQAKGRKRVRGVFLLSEISNCASIVSFLTFEIVCVWR